MVKRHSQAPMTPIRDSKHRPRGGGRSRGGRTKSAAGGVPQLPSAAGPGFGRTVDEQADPKRIVRKAILLGGFTLEESLRWGRLLDRAPDKKAYDDIAFRLGRVLASRIQA